MELGLKDKTAFITGAGKGIGRAIAMTLAEYGVDIVATGISLTGIEQTAEEVRRKGRKALAISTDVSNKAQVLKSVNKAIGNFHRVDILVNCAGINPSSLLVDLSEDLWDKTIDTNLKGVFLVSQEISKHMIKNKYGKIINISSQAGKVGELGNGVYCAAKAAVIMLTQVQALELAEYNINVNAICPGYTDTAMIRKVIDERGPIEGMTPKEYEELLVSGIPMKRMAKPEEIGELVAFLSSDKSSYITGIAHTISGGKILF